MMEGCSAIPLGQPSPPQNCCIGRYLYGRLMFFTYTNCCCVGDLNPARYLLFNSIPCLGYLPRIAAFGYQTVLAGHPQRELEHISARLSITHQFPQHKIFSKIGRVSPVTLYSIACFELFVKHFFKLFFITYTALLFNYCFSFFHIISSKKYPVRHINSKSLT